MLALYKLTDLWQITFILLALVALFLHCCFYQAALPVRHRDPYRHKFLELSILFLLFTLCMTISAANVQVSLDLPAVTKYAELRYVAGAMTVVQALSWFNRKVGAEIILVAGFLAFPFCDVLAPWNLLAAILLLAGRSILGIPKARERLRHELSSDSINEAIDTLPTGVMFSDNTGNIILANTMMLNLMQLYSGQQYRDANVLWRHLQSLKNTSYLQKLSVGDKLLFRVRNGPSYLAARQSIRTEAESCNQLTITDVTEEDRSALMLEEQLKLLRADSKKMRSALDNLEALKRQQTLAEVTSQIHDLLGQRITILQQLLNNNDTNNYDDMIPLMQNLVQDIRNDVREDAHETLNNIVATYASIGVTITIAGELPKEKEIATAFVSIIREAATNSVRHSHANLIQIVMNRQNGKQYLQTTDNGIALSEVIHFGTGLNGIKQRIERLGGTLTVNTKPRFTLLMEVPL
jgi:signal transduction histidine kinase